MRRLAGLLAVTCLLTLGACATTAAKASAAPCICGTPDAAVHGCHHPDCVAGTGNAANPDCHCAPVKVATPAKTKGAA